MAVRLTRKDISEAAGADAPLADLTDLELLFTSFRQIAELHNTPRLNRLCMIDNGLQEISHLEPVALSLRSLTICDQPLKVIVGNTFQLPNLEELFLHRNQLHDISGLTGCPRVRKLWMFQNQLHDIQGIQALSCLEELWIQSNKVHELGGLKLCRNLVNLSIAGNPISDFAEVRKLRSLTQLRSLTMNDVHFGKCPLANESIYRDFVINTLKTLSLLDDVQVTKDKVSRATDMYGMEVSKFLDEMHHVDESFCSDVDTINVDFKGKENYSLALEKEMSMAISELESLVRSNRKSVNASVEGHKTLLSGAMTSLEAQLHQIMNDVVLETKDNLKNAGHNLDLAKLYFQSLASVCRLEARVISALSGEIKSRSSEGSKGKTSLKFQALTSTCPDFFYVSSRLYNKPVHLDFGGAQGGSEEVEVMKAYRMFLPGEIAETTRHELSGVAGDTNESNETRTTRKHVHSCKSAKERDRPCLIYTIFEQSHVAKIVHDCEWVAREGKDQEVNPGRRIFSSHANLAALLYNISKETDEVPSNSFDDDERIPTSAAVQRSHAEMGSTRPFIVGICSIETSVLKNRNVIEGSVSSLQREGTAKLSHIKADLRRESVLVQYNDLTSISPASSSPFFLSLTCDECVQYLHLDYICICVSPALVGGSGPKGVENRLDALLSRSSKSSRDASLMQKYNDTIIRRVQHNYDQLMEQVTGSDAHVFQVAEGNVSDREDRTHSIVLDIEGERRDQEVLLRAMRASALK